METKSLSPLKAIKKHCLTFCMNGNSDLVTTCKEHSECIFHSKLTNLKKIKEFCKECASDFQPWKCTGEVLNTPETREYGKCPLHSFRMGRNPNRKGIGNKNAIAPNQKRHNNAI